MTVENRVIQATLDKMVSPVKLVTQVMMVTVDLGDQPGHPEPKANRVELVSMASMASKDPEVRSNSSV